MKTQETISSASEVIEAQILREVRPCVDLRVDMNALLDRQTLNNTPHFYPERHARTLFLSASKQNYGTRQTVWLRILPQSEHMIYEFADLAASDLERCQHVFAQVKGYQNHVGYLTDLTASSFPGNRAITLVYNLMAITELNDVLFVDGAMSLSCCTSRALLPVRSLGIFSKGKSWYESQGATAKISNIAFGTISLYQYESYGIISSANLDPRILVTKDLDFNVFQENKLFIQESQPSAKAYRKACQFLHTLSVQTLDDSLFILCKNYPKLWKLRSALITDSSSYNISIGEFVTACQQKAKKEGKGSTEHSRYHDMCDRLISNKGSVFFQYIFDRLFSETEHTPLSCILAWCVVESFFRSLQDCGITKNIALRMLHEMLVQGDKFRESLEKSMGSLFEAIVLKDVFCLESDTSPTSVKICANSTHQQREDYSRYLSQKGVENEFFAAQVAFFHLATIPLSKLRAVYPELCSAFEKITSMSFDNLSPQYVLGELFTLSDMHEKPIEQYLLHELILGSYKHISTLFTSHIDCATLMQRDPRNAYSLFMISKFICEETNFFSMHL